MSSIIVYVCATLASCSLSDAVASWKSDNQVTTEKCEKYVHKVPNTALRSIAKFHHGYALKDTQGVMAICG